MPNRTTARFALVAIVFASITSLAAADTPGVETPSGPVQVLRITPDGDTNSSERQIVVQFDRPMVVLGSVPPKLDNVPVSITPALECNWHWVNTSTLACELSERGATRTREWQGFQVEQGGLEPATTYQVTVHPGLKAVDGNVLDKEATSEFTTEKPEATYGFLNQWTGPTSPVMTVEFNLPVTKSSVEAHLFFSASGKRVSVSATGNPRDTRGYYVLPAAGGQPVFIPVSPAQAAAYNEAENEDEEGGEEESGAEAAPAPATTAPAKEATPPPAGEEARFVWLLAVRPGSSLPGGESVTLSEETGLVTPFGPVAGETSRDLTSIWTYGDFTFEGVGCYGETAVSFSGLECDPQVMSYMEFSSPVHADELKAHVTGQVDKKKVELIDNVPSDRQWMRSEGRDGQHFDVGFPMPLKANADYAVQVTAGMKDVWGRTLKQGGEATLHTTHRNPDFRIDEDTAVLEKNVDSEVPLYFTNLQSLDAYYTRWTMPKPVSLLGINVTNVPPDAVPSAEQKGLSYKLPNVEDLSVGIPMGVRGMLDGESGVVTGKLVPNPSPGNNDRNFKFFAEVTPYQVEVKVGHYNTLVWVTDMSTGLPVAGARVVIYSAAEDDPGAEPKGAPAAMTDASGVAMLPGGSVIDPTATLRRPHYGDDSSAHLMVRVNRGSNMAFLPLTYEFQVNTYQASHYKVGSEIRKLYGHVHAWGTTAEGIYRAGDTIQYKIYVRDQDNNRFVAPPNVAYTLSLEDPMGNVVFKQENVKLSDFGGYSGEYTVPKTAPVGWYTFRLVSKDLPESLEPMRVLVSDFTPASFHVDAFLNGSRFEPGDKVEVTTTARLHSGGPYTGAQGRVSVTLKGEDFTSSDPVAQDFTFSSYDAETNEREQTVNETTGGVGDDGVMKVDFDLQDAGIYYGKLLAEGDVRDDRGKYIAGLARADYIGRDRFVGLRQHGWVMHAQEPTSVDYIVVDGAGKPVAGSNVSITVERLDLKASRVKGPGDAYLTQYVRQWVPSGSCQAVATDKPGVCTFTPDAPGSFRIKASVTDTHGRVHNSSLPGWAVGKGEVVWEDNDDGALNIVPEKAEYHVGDTARYLVQNPYPGAKALVSIERYGVLKSWVQTLEGSTPVVSFPVEQDYVPGFYLSVTVVSPRVAKPLPKPGEVDLGKPTFRSGYLEVPVTDDYKALDVKVSTPKDTYKPRDNVTVNVNVKARHGNAGNVELAVAVLDDSVFDLLAEGKDYFDPYKGFYSLDGLDLENYSLLTRLVGRQAFEKKGATPGGDGGAAISLRSLFKFVSYWNPSIRTDAAGNAKFTFAVPDNLTGWRVLVVAVNSTDRMGLGQDVFKVNRPTELQPVMPNQVVQGDKFTAGFSVMNRTDKPRDLKVHVVAHGSVEGSPVLDQVVHVDPYKRADVWLPVGTTGPGSVDFTATAGDALDSDGLKQSVPVNRMVTLVHLAQYGTTTAPATEPVQYPADAVPDSVELGVNLTPTVIGNVQGAFTYMSEYPYLCWEQRLTKAVMAANYKRLKPYMGKDFAWAASEGIPAETLADAASFQAPNGGMTYWVADNRYVDPYLSAYTALVFNWLRAQGYTVPQAVEKNLHGYLQEFLKDNTAPDYYTQGMRSSVRAVALAALAADHEATLEDLRRFEPSVREMSLFGKAWFMQAALDLNGQDLATEGMKLILNQSNETAGKFEFSEALDDGYRRILSTPLRSNCVILTAFSHYAKSSAANAAAVADVPFKLVRSITQMHGGRDHWENTQENLFCMQALADYADAYEKTAPAMHVAVTLGKDVLGAADFHAVSDAAVLLKHPLAKPASAEPLPVAITPTGPGRLYYTVQLAYAPSTLPSAINDGMEIHREYSVERDGKWQLLKSPMQINRGELVRVDLYVSVPAAREFVVVDDPVPGGLEPVDRNLATSSTRDVKAGGFQAAGGAYWFNFDDWEDYGVQFWDFYHQELRHDSARFYADYLPGGHYHLSYSAQAIATGTFVVQPSKVEEMYDPDVFGLDASSVLQVNEAQSSSP